MGLPADVKYIDPTYMIRACRANASDGILCTVLGQNAVSITFVVTIAIYSLSQNNVVVEGKNCFKICVILLLPM